ncbi:MAG: YfhO family protein [Clostridia bacterium]|nr:YfhO family protein [Clostridia bacterium]
MTELQNQETEIKEKERKPLFWNEKRKNFWKEHRYLLLCMLIPAVLIYLIYLARQIHPFGDGCVLVLDLNGQYVWFFEALRNFVQGDAELLYSFSRALGGEFLGIFAYYVASPLSYIVALFPEDRMLEALLTLFLLKGALCGGTFGYYMHKTEKLKSKLAIVIFSTFYALSSYALVQQNNTMWIDAVMWLPLITLGIESLIKYGKFKLYTVFLALTLFSNYYIGYMICIWCLIYFFIYYFAHNEDKHNNPLGERWHFLRSLGRIALYSAVAMCMVAVILLGAYYSLNFGKTTFSDPSWEWKLNFDLLDFFYKLLPGSYDTVRPAGLPFVYCGVLTILLIPFYFLSRRYPMRQKIFSGVLIFILFASFALSVPDLIWHGFQRPNWLNYRYSFMFTFYLCVLACRAFSNFEEISLKAMMGTGGLIALLCVVLQKYSDGEYVDPNDFTCIYFTLIMIFAYLAVLGVMRNSAYKQVVSVTLVAIVAAEAFLNGLWNINALDEDVGYSRYSYYNNFLNKARPIVEEVQKSDTSFYRMEKTFFRKVNDNMALSMRGLSGSTSTLNKETVKFLNKMGYSSKSHWSKYLGGTPVNDSLLGLKYIISDNDIYANYYEVYKTDEKNGYTAYYNPYALSIAFGVDEDVLDFKLGFADEAPVEDQDSTEEEEAIPSAVSSIKGVLNQWLDIEEMTGTVYEDDYVSPFERLNAMVTAMLGEEETVRIFVPATGYTFDEKGVTMSFYAGGEHGYKKPSAETEGVITYTVTTPVDGELFFYLPTNYPREVKLTLSVDGGEPQKWGTFNGNETTRIISLGMQKAGSKIDLEMTMVKNDFYVLSNQECFYYIDWTVFKDAMGRLAQDQYVITDYTESSFDGTFTASDTEELVLTTLPYDNGWHVYVDGSEVEITKAFGALIAFEINGEAGQTHQVSLVYAPRAIGVGLIISIIGVLLFIALLVLDHFFSFGCKPPKKVTVVPYPKSSKESVEDPIYRFDANDDAMEEQLRDEPFEELPQEEFESMDDGDVEEKPLRFRMLFPKKEEQEADESQGSSNDGDRKD